jgi:hypothetical protein
MLAAAAHGIAITCQDSLWFTACSKRATTPLHMASHRRPDHEDDRARRLAADITGWRGNRSAITPPTKSLVGGGMTPAAQDDPNPTFDPVICRSPERAGATGVHVLPAMEIACAVRK